MNIIERVALGAFAYTVIFILLCIAKEIGAFSEGECIIISIVCGLVGSIFIIFGGKEIVK